MDPLSLIIYVLLGSFLVLIIWRIQIFFNTKRMSAVAPLMKLPHVPSKVDARFKVRNLWHSLEEKKEKKRCLVIAGDISFAFHLVNAIVESNQWDRVFVLEVCPQFKHFTFPSKQVKVVSGNTFQIDEIADLAIGCDTIFHSGLLHDYRDGPLHWKRLYDHNVVGTWNVICAAIMAGVSNLILTSDIRAETIHHPLNDQVHSKGQHLSTFGHSVRLAEDAILAINNQNNLNTCVVRTSELAGEWDGFTVKLRQNASIPREFASVFHAAQAHVEIAIKMIETQSTQSLSNGSSLSEGNQSKFPCGEIFCVSDFSMSTSQLRKRQVEIATEAGVVIPNAHYEINLGVLWLIENVFDNFLTAGTMQWNRRFSRSYFEYLNSISPKTKNSSIGESWNAQRHFDKLKQFYRDFYSKQ